MCPPSEQDTRDHPRTMRLQRFLARAGAASRRGSEDLMTAGRVQVNGTVVSELGSKVDPERDVVCVDGIRYRLSDESCYLMLYKPAGCLTTMKDPYGRPCVAELVPTRSHPGLFPVGRLDEDTTGLLLFTTNGEVAHQLLHPSHHVWKGYLALVEGRVGEGDLERLRTGVALDDGMTSPAKAELAGPHDKASRAVCPKGVPAGCSLVSISLHEGRKHQVKRMFEALGHPVVRLHRHSFGPLTLSGVRYGKWRPLSVDEQEALLCAAGREPFEK